MKQEKMWTILAHSGCIEGYRCRWKGWDKMKDILLYSGIGIFLGLIGAVLLIGVTH